MSAIVIAEGRPTPKTAEERAAVFNSALGYSGRYRIDGDQIHTEVDLAWNQAWVGTAQVRSFRVTEDHLQLISAWAASPFEPERIIRGIVEWEREA